MTKPHRNVQIQGLLCFAILCVYLATASGRIGTADSMAMWSVTRSISHGEGFSADPCLPVAQGNHCVPGRDGRNYSGFGLLPSLLAAPVFKSAELIAQASGQDVQLTTGTALSLFTVLIGALTPCLLTLWLNTIGLPMHVAVLGGATLAFASSHWHHSVKGFYSEPYATLFLVCAVLAGAKGRTFYAGICLGLACLCRVQLVVLLPCIASYAIASNFRSASSNIASAAIVEQIFRFGSGFSGPILLLAWSNWIRFGSPLKTGYHLVFPSTALLFAAPFWEGLKGILLDPEVGLLIYTPWIITIFFFHCRSISQFRNELLLAVSICCIQIAFFSKYSAWHGGWSYGPRLFVPALPFFVLLCMLSMHGTWTLKAKWLRYCFASVLLGAALIHAAISLYPMNRYYLRHIFESACGTTLSPPLVIATFQELPALFDSTIGVQDSHAVSDEAERLRHMARLNDNICSYPSSEDYLAATPNAINQMTLDIVWVKLARLGVSPGVGLWISALLLLTSAIAWIGWGSGWKGLIAQKKRNRNT